VNTVTKVSSKRYLDRSRRTAPRPTPIYCSRLFADNSCERVKFLYLVIFLCSSLLTRVLEKFSGSVNFCPPTILLCSQLVDVFPSVLHGAKDDDIGDHVVIADVVGDFFDFIV